MTPAPRTVTEETPLATAALLLFENGLKRVPVMQEGRLVGMLSRSDVVRALSGMGQQMAAVAASDAGIRDGITTRISRAGFVSAQQVAIAVADGVVTLRGVVTSAEQRLALTVLAESEPGVLEVRDELRLTTALVVDDAGVQERTA